MSLIKFDTDSVMKRKVFRGIADISRSTEWRLGREGDLPELIKVGGRVLGYSNNSVVQWIEEHKVYVRGVEK